MATEVVLPTMNDDELLQQQHDGATSSSGDEQTDLVDVLDTKCTLDESEAKCEAEVQAVVPQTISQPSTVDAKQRKKLDKLIDGLLRKSTSGCHTLDDKYYALATRFVTLQDENKALTTKGRESERTVSNAFKQREQLQNEHSKSLLAKSKLESLCRELQKHNKIIKDENLQRIREEEEKRKEITAKFQLAIDEINVQVASNADKNNTLIQENVQLATKLKTLLEQYELREQHVEKVLKHKELELQLANAKLQQSDLKLAEVTERSKKEKAIYEVHCGELSKKCTMHQEAEKQLRAQLAIYTQKYEEFQSTLTKSNQVFESFRTEMDKMTKKMKKLEQEAAQWRSKFEGSQKSLAAIAEQKEQMDKDAKKLQVRADTMEQLSRTLQTERNTLKQEITELKFELKAVHATKVDDEVKEDTQVADQSADQSSTQLSVEISTPSPAAQPDAVDEAASKLMDETPIETHAPQ